MSQERKLVRDYRDIHPDYAFDADIFNAEPERIARVKEVIAGLPPADRIIFLMYTDCGSVRKLAERLNFSHTTIHKEVVRIRREIIAAYNKKTQSK